MQPNIITKKFPVNIRGIESQISIAFDGDRSDPIHSYLNRGQLWGQDLLWVSQKFWKDSDVVILDIGAHIGTYAIQASQYTLGKVIAIEASPKNFQYLQRNKALNRAHNLAIHNVAAARKLGQLSFAEEGSGAHVSLDGDKPDAIVVAIPLDDILASETRLDFIKLDIEGFEIEALYGMNATLKKFMPPILFEVNGHTLNFFDETPNTLFNAVKHFGYEIFLIDNQLIPIDASKPFPFGVRDCIAVPPAILNNVQKAARKTFLTNEEIETCFKQTDETGNEDIKNYLKIYREKLENGSAYGN